ncbi:ABC-2 type transport system ATP-binding protein [Nocardiopsis sp. Huas11]|uniref:ATP-binding cassette domain-containing protein n=1 Tax=Nocardiopsis sp. Huas11 TaxID=2183912 RepID=UPI000F181910|nr:ABC-2 type transport system ATP-binding protein [Nocardiopsis sp. Huas11]
MDNAFEESGADDPMIMVRDLEKSYGQVHAVRGIDLDVEKGELFGLLGPNGAGKSTFIGMLATILTPTAGVGEVAGHDILWERAQVRRNIGLVFQEQTLDRYLTAWHNLRFHAEIYGVPRAQVDERVTAALHDVGLWDERLRLAGTFSGGMRRRLEIARGLLHSPRLLFLDEPTAGLDPRSREQIWERVHRLNKEEGVTVFMTTHYLEEAEHCDRIAIVDQGRIVALGSPAELKAGIGRDRVEVTAEDAVALAEDVRTEFGIDTSVEGSTVRFSVKEGSSFLPDLFSRVRSPITSVRVSSPSLDDVFLERTGRALDQEPGSAAEQDPLPA